MSHKTVVGLPGFHCMLWFKFYFGLKIFTPVLIFILLCLRFITINKLRQRKIKIKLFLKISKPKKKFEPQYNYKCSIEVLEGKYKMIQSNIIKVKMTMSYLLQTTSSYC